MFFQIVLTDNPAPKRFQEHETIRDRPESATSVAAGSGVLHPNA
jgi:hypothetical protein